MESYVAILLSAFFSVSVGLAAVWFNIKTNKRNRNISTVMQLSKDFYQDNDFTMQRLQLWNRLEELPDEEHDFDNIMKLMKDDRTSSLKVEEVVALNRTAAFYNTLKSLIDKGEVDLEMLQLFFGYNYNRFWEPERKKFQNHSTEKAEDKTFFREIPELKND